MGEDIKIVIGGDLFPTPINYSLFSEGRTREIFGEKVTSIFSEADYSICNLEGCLTSELTPPKPKGGPNIRAPKECVSAIAGLGVDCVSLANNHATDYGAEGLQDTFDALGGAGIDCFGAGLTASDVTTHRKVELKGKTFIFYGVSETLENAPGENAPGANVYDEYRICRELKELKAACDYLIVLYHGGVENTHYCTQSIRTRFHRMVDSGADIVISQHTHAIGEEERYGGSYLLYGQGNFCFHFSREVHEWTESALLLSVTFHDATFDVEKHLVKRAGASVAYAEDQSLADFESRSRRLEAGDTFDAELSKAADMRFTLCLRAFRGNNLMDRIAYKLLPRSRFNAYIRGKYSENQILKIRMILESEEFREVAMCAFTHLLESTREGENRNE